MKNAQRLALATCLTTLFLIAIGLALFGLVRSSLVGEFDAVLGSKARVLSIMVVEGDEGAVVTETTCNWVGLYLSCASTP